METDAVMGEIKSFKKALKARGFDNGSELMVELRGLKKFYKHDGRS